MHEGICEFPPKSPFISEMVRDRFIVIVVAVGKVARYQGKFPFRTLVLTRGSQQLVNG